MASALWPRPDHEWSDPPVDVAATGTVRSDAIAAQPATARPATKTGHGNTPGRSPATRAGALATKLPTTSNPPATAANTRTKLTRGIPPAPTCRAASNPKPMRHPLTAIGAQTGPAHGTGIRKRTSHVTGEWGQPMKTHSQK